MKNLFMISMLLFIMACNSGNKKTEKLDTAGIAGIPPTEINPAIAANNPADVLPDIAKKFISEHFPNTTIIHVENKESPVTNGTVFNVEISDKTEIDFDKDGEWRELEAEDEVGLPITFLPSTTQQYLKSNYANIKVSAVDMEMNHIAIDLVNDMDLIFDKEGNFLRIAN